MSNGALIKVFSSVKGGHIVHRSILIKIAICSVAFLFCLHGGSFKVDAANANLQSLRILDTIPQSDAGISTSTIVPDDTCFGVLIESTYPIDTVDPGSIRFEIDDGIHYVYERDLSSATIRVLEVTGDDPGQNLIWVVYDRSLEIQLLPLYYPDRIVHITVYARDIHQNTLSPIQVRFKIGPDPGYSVNYDAVPDYDFVDSFDLTSETLHDSGLRF